MGENLDKAVTVEAERLHIKKLITSVKGAGDFKDEMELHALHADCPSQLANIMKTAPSFTHPDRGCTVWLNRNLNHSEEQIDVKQEMERMTMAGETKVKRRKVEKLKVRS